MATQYADNNGSTSGFGTLNANWTSSIWTSSTAGTTVPGNWVNSSVTPNVAQFGYSGTTVTAQSNPVTAAIHIPSGNTIYVNGIVASNLGGFYQYIDTATASSTAMLVPTGTNPYFNVDNSVSGTGLGIWVRMNTMSNLTKTGSGPLQIGNPLFSASAHAVGSTFTINGGSVVFRGYNTSTSSFYAAAVNNNLSAVTSWVINNPGSIVVGNNFGNVSVNTAASYSGTGLVDVYDTSTNTFTTTFSAEGALSGLTGSTAPSTSSPVFYNGLLLRAESGYPYSIVNTKSLPRVINFYTNAFGAETFQTINYNSANATHNYSTTETYIYTYQASNITYYIGSAWINANQVSGALIIGNIIKTGTTSLGAGCSGRLNLGGSSTATNTVSGVISNSAGVLTLYKSDAGTWRLSNAANTYSGGTTLNGGTLEVIALANTGSNSSIGTGNTTATITFNGGTLQHYGSWNDTTNRPISLSGNGTLTVNDTGSVTYRGIVSSAPDRNLTLGGNSSNALNDFQSYLPTGSFTKTGTGTWKLSYSASTYAGLSTISAGTLLIPKLANSSVNSSLGAGTTISIGGGATLKHYGSNADTCNRELTITGSFALDSSDTGSLSYSGTAAASLSNNATVTLTGDSVASNTFSTALPVTIGFDISLAKTGSGYWIVSGASTFTGSTTLSLGTLRVGNSSALGSSSSVSAITLNAGTLELFTNLTKTNAPVTFGGSTISGLAGNNTFTFSSGTLGTTTTFDIASSGTLTLLTANAITGAGFGITKNGLGELRINHTGVTYNSFTGAVTINNGTLGAYKLAVTGNPSSIGTGSVTSAIAMAPGTSLIHYGSLNNDTTNRQLTLSGAGTYTLGVDDAGSLIYTGVVSVPAATVTFTLTGSSTNSLNEITSTLADGASGTFSLTKDGTGTWKATGPLNYTGATTVSAGTLNLGSTTNRTMAGPLAMTGGTLTNGSYTIQPTSIVLTSGTISSVLTGSAVALTTTGTGTTSLQPNNATKSNTFTGNSTISSGATIDLIAETSVSTAGNGLVLGSSNTVIVQNGGIIRTKQTATQKGSARYNNLTLETGSKIRIGYAA